MKIATLGISGSGKSTYTSGMAIKFYFAGANVNGYHIEDRQDDGEEYSGYEYKSFKELNTIIEDGKFPPSTGTTTRFRLMLCKDCKALLPIDWIDYRGGALKDFARNEIQEKDKKLHADLLDSSVIIVFTDAARLKALIDMGAYSTSIANDVGANEISKVLKIVQNHRKSKKLETRVMFVLSKFDSSTIDPEKDFPKLKNMLEKIYSLFIRENKGYQIYPVGVVGLGNVETEVEYKKDENNGKDILEIRHTIGSRHKVHPYNIDSSFAQVLLMAMEAMIETSSKERKKYFSKREPLDTEVAEIERKSKSFRSTFFGISAKDTEVLRITKDYDDKIDYLNAEIKMLSPHRDFLKEIAEQRSSEALTYEC